MTSLYEN